MGRLRVSAEAFELEFPARAEGSLELTVYHVNIRFVQFGEALPPDAAPELCDVQAAAHLDDAERFAILAAGLAGLYTWYHEPSSFTPSYRCTVG